MFLSIIKDQTHSFKDIASHQKFVKVLVSEFVGNCYSESHVIVEDTRIRSHSVAGTLGKNCY